MKAVTVHVRVHFAAVLVGVRVLEPLLVALSDIPFCGIGNSSAGPRPAYVITT